MVRLKTLWQSLGPQSVKTYVKSEALRRHGGFYGVRGVVSGFAGASGAKLTVAALGAE